MIKQNMYIIISIAYDYNSLSMIIWSSLDAVLIFFIKINKGAYYFSPIIKS